MAPNMWSKESVRDKNQLSREILETIPGTSGIGRGGAPLSSPANSPHEAHVDPELVVVAALDSW